MFSA
jgi:putative transposase